MAGVRFDQVYPIKKRESGVAPFPLELQTMKLPLERRIYFVAAVFFSKLLAGLILTPNAKRETRILNDDLAEIAVVSYASKD